MLAENSAPAFAFISMLRDGTDARALAGLLEGLALSEATAAATFLVPEVRGLDFFAEESRQDAVDRWWARQVPADAMPVYLLAHEPGLADWLMGLDGRFLVAVDNEATAAEYPDEVVVRGDSADPALALAEAVVTSFGGLPSAGRRMPAAAVFDLRDAAMIARVRGGDSRTSAATLPVRPAEAARDQPRASVPDSDLPSAWRAVPRAPALLELDTSHVCQGAFDPDGDIAARPDPIALLVADSAERERQDPIWSSGRDSVDPRAAGHRTGAAGLLATLARGPRLVRGAARDRATVTDAELAALLLSRPGRVVVVGSRKGGVGKTSHAAGMAIAAGSALDAVGHVAGLVDANIANPDAWGQLRLPPHAATVRDVVSALASGTLPPQPVHATTPALACYPERRDGAEYGRVDIRRLATHLRAHHALVIVDMSNRLPDPTGGPEAAVAAHWLAEADALVLPTAMSRQDFNGVLDYLDVGDLPPTVVPCIVSSARRNRRHPLTREYLELITARVDKVIEVPDEADRVRLAGMEGVPVQQVSNRMRDSYREMLLAVARLPAPPAR